MIWFFAILVVLALGGVAVVAAGRGQPMGPAYDDAPDSLVPSDEPVTLWVCRRVSASNSSSSVPRPPGSTTKPWEYFTNIVLRAKK